MNYDEQIQVRNRYRVNRFLLTMTGILVAAAKLIKNGKLGAQKHNGCMNYYGDGCRCIVGGGLPLDLAKACDGGTVHSLRYDHGVVSVPDEEQYKDMQELQRRHDAWARARGAFLPSNPIIKDRRKQFYNKLNEFRKKYGVNAKGEICAETSGCPNS